MNFTASEDIDAPVEAVFREVTDFAAFERAARRRGAELRRTDGPSASGVGLCWHARFTLRGRPREADVTVVSYEPPRELVLEARSHAIDGCMRVDLVALLAARTRLGVDLTLTPRGIAGRVMMHPFKLMHASLARRFRLRVAEFAMDTGTRFRSRA